MHGVIRRYRVRLGTVATAARFAETDLLPRMKQLPGFVAYYLLDAGDGIVASITVCQTAEGAAAAAALAADWFRSDWPSFQLLPPELTDGEVLVHAAVARADGAGRRRSERRGTSDQRMVADRRVEGERRQATVPVEVERRSGVERRISGNRRAGMERRAAWAAAQEARPAARRLGVAPPWRKPTRTV